VSYDGSQLYDDDAVFDLYSQRRARTDNPNDTLEKPVILELIGPVAGLDVLDLGCGDAAFGRELLAGGARSYLGIDGSANMIRAAHRNLAGTGAHAVHADITVSAPQANSFDLATARLVFHYVDSLREVLVNVRQALRPGGRLVFSVEHPVITSSNKALANDGPRQDWIVDDYFNSGARIVSWLGAQVVKHHRTVDDYFLAVQQAGFSVTSIRESKPDRHHFVDEATYRRRLRIPLFLFVAAEKASPAC
jgi:SAM-dependent methyltransferase